MIRRLRPANTLARHGMKRLALGAALVLASPGSPRADGGEQITLRVGQRKALGGYAPVCDDPSVAVITADGGGVLVAKGEGKTTCSVQQPGGRHIVDVVVLPNDAKPRDEVAPSKDAP